MTVMIFDDEIGRAFAPHEVERAAKSGERAAQVLILYADEIAGGLAAIAWMMQEGVKLRPEFHNLTPRENRKLAALCFSATADACSEDVQEVAREYLADPASQF
jgi:hypothetical protein